LLLQEGTDLIEKKFDLRLEEDLANYWNRMDYVSLVAYVPPSLHHYFTASPLELAV